MAPVEEERATEHLAQFCTYERGELFGDVVTIVRTLRSDADFHQLVCFERRIDRGNDPVSQAVFAKLNERIEVMSERSQVSSLLSGQAHGHPRSIERS